MSASGCGCVPSLFRRENQNHDNRKDKKKKKKSKKNKNDLPMENNLQVSDNVGIIEKVDEDLMECPNSIVVENYDEKQTVRMSSRNKLEKQKTMSDITSELEMVSEEQKQPKTDVAQIDGVVTNQENAPEPTDDDSSTGSTNTGSTTIAVASRQSDSTKLSSPECQDNASDQPGLNGVWSPSTQKRSLRLDLSQIKNHGDDSASTSGKGSPAQSSTRESSEITEEPSSSVWQPFGAPAETPQFRSVKLDGLPAKAQTSSSPQPKTPPAHEESKSFEQINKSSFESNHNEVPPVTIERHTESKIVSDAEGSDKSKSTTSTTTSATISAWNRSGRGINLPPSQSPTITLLQKAREGQIPKGAVYIDEKSSKVTPIPKDAVLIDQKVTVEGDKIHTDSYYAVPTSIATGEVTTHVIKAPKYDGIGPTECGIPVALRTCVKDEYSSDWYKTMYRSLHKTADDAKNHMQTVHLGGYMSEPEYDRRPYRPDYSTMECKRKTDKYLTAADANRTEARSPEIVVKKVTDDALTDSTVSSRLVGTYRNQPRSIAEYEPGHSSLADQEFQKFWDDFWDSMEDLNEHFRHSPKPLRSYEKRRWPNALLCDGYESDSTLIRKTVNPPPRLDPDQQKAWYKEIQKGGDIPLTGLRKPAPEKPKESPHQYQETEVNIHYKAPIRSLEKDYIEEEELRKRQEDAMRKFYAEERQKKQLQQMAEIEMRRHCDNFTPSQKSPIPLNRYDNPFETSYTLKRLGSPTEYPRTLAQVLYPFVAQSTRELSLSKGDIVYINRQIDKNWYEGEHHGFVGIFPVSYVAVIPTEKANLQPKKAFEGHGMIKYTFRAKTPMELSVFKGERIILTRRVDNNWYEGRIGAKKGILPVSYVDVLQEPGDSNLRSENAISPKPPASPVYSPIINGNPYKPSSSPTYVSGSAPLQKNQIPDLRVGDKISLTQSLHVDTYNEPIPYRSLYSYHPQNDDELELREGDTVYVMEKCDDGWYVGTSLRTGLFGTFPGNYVERI